MDDFDKYERKFILGDLTGFEYLGSQLTFQRWIYVVSMLWINVDPIFKMRQNPTADFQRYKTSVGARR